MICNLNKQVKLCYSLPILQLYVWYILRKLNLERITLLLIDIESLPRVHINR